MKTLPLEFSSLKMVPEKFGIYIIFANKYFPRLHGKTNILYIGMAEKRTLRERLFTFPMGFRALEEGREFNKRRAIKRFWNLRRAGFALTCTFHPSGTPKKLEQKLLLKFEKKHLELPPLNHAN